MKITICRCAHRPTFNPQTIERVVSVLQQSKYEVNVVDDLCEIAEIDVDRFREIVQHSVIACYPRLFRSLCEWRKIDFKATYYSLRNVSSEELFQEMGVEATETVPHAIPDAPSLDVEAWYPVIDRDRCTNCAKCFDFCLFGVYSLHDGVTHVSNPTNCKNNCPACARNCPSTAIIFPKYPKSPINGGVKEEEAIAIGNEADADRSLRERLEKRREAGRKILR